MNNKGYLLLFTCVFLFSSLQSGAQDKNDEHLLDGTSMNYYYQNGSAVHIEFFDTQVKFKWLAGSLKGTESQEYYRSRKIGDKMYVVSFQVEANSNFATIIFNFNQNVMCSSVIHAPGTDLQQIFFDGGIIEQLKLKEN